MGAYDSNPRRDSVYDSNPRPPWTSVANDVDRVNDRFAGLAVSEESDSSSIHQVMRAVEDAENTIKQQVSDWILLKSFGFLVDLVVRELLSALVFWCLSSGNERNGLRAFIYET